MMEESDNTALNGRHCRHVEEGGRDRGGYVLPGASESFQTIMQFGETVSVAEI